MTGFVTFLQNYLISIIALAGLIVLCALHDVTSAVAVPVVIGLTGVHVGANIGSNVPGTLGSNTAAAPVVQSTATVPKTVTGA